MSSKEDQQQFEESAQRVYAAAKAAEREKLRKSRRKRAVLRYIADNWIAFLSLVVAIVALIRTF